MDGIIKYCGGCAPCEQDCCCEKMIHPEYAAVHSGCCDCKALGIIIGWNWLSGTVTTAVAAPCPDPETYSVYAVPEPACLSVTLAAHGGFQQVEIYLQDCPPTREEGVADFIVASLQGTVGIYGSSLDPLVATGSRESCTLSLGATDGTPAKACFIVRANDGFEVARCVLCLEGADIILPPCSSSSSSSSSSSDSSSSSSSSSSDSSSSSSSSSSSDPSSSSSSSSSDSSSSSNSSSSSSEPCACSMDLVATDNPEDPFAPTLTTNYIQTPTDCAPGSLSCLFTYDPPQVDWVPGMTVTITATCSQGGLECTDFTSYTIPSSSSSSS